jgi:hypothetical protein
MQLGNDFNKVEGTTGGGGFTVPECKGYTFRVVNVVDKQSSKGEPMLEIHFDIAMGEHQGAFEKYPKIKYLPYGTPEGRGRLKGTLDLIIGQNKAMFPEADPFADGAFDEQRLIGCLTGGVLKWDPYQGKNYLKMNYLCTSEEADAAKVIPEPAIAETASGDNKEGWTF